MSTNLLVPQQQDAINSNSNDTTVLSSNNHLQTLRFSNGVRGYLLTADGHLAGIGGSDTHVTFPGKIAAQIIDFPTGTVLTGISITQSANQPFMNLYVTAGDSQGAAKSTYRLVYRTENQQSEAFQQALVADPNHFLYQFVLDFSKKDLRVVTYRQNAFSNTAAAVAANSPNGGTHNIIASSGSVVAGIGNPLSIVTPIAGAVSPGASSAAISSPTQHIIHSTGTSSAQTASMNTFAAAASTGTASTTKSKLKVTTTSWLPWIIGAVLLLLLIGGCIFAKSKGAKWSEFRTQLASQLVLKSQQDKPNGAPINNNIQSPPPPPTQNISQNPQQQSNNNNNNNQHSNDGHIQTISNNNNHNNNHSPSTGNSVTSSSSSSSTPAVVPQTIQNHYHLPTIPEHLSNPSYYHHAPQGNMAMNNTPLSSIYPHSQHLNYAAAPIHSSNIIPRGYMY